MTDQTKPARRFNPFTALGPGLITGAADDDPSGIATYSQAGAGFGLQMLWTVVLTYPFMAVFQSICARIGRVSGRGLASNIRAIFPPWIVFAVVVLLLGANILNIAADLAAMGEAASLVAGGHPHIYTAVFAAVTLALQILVPYHRYVRLLKWLTLALFAYVAVAFIVHAPWLEVLKATVAPKLEFTAAEATLVVAIFGTTISPYLFFWQASEEVEELNASGATPLTQAPGEAPEALRRIRWDTYLGMAFSNLIAFFIILSTAVTLHAAGVTEIGTAGQAAEALRPIAGDFAFALFALGIIGTGLLAIPTLAGSAAYALSETLGWKEGLERRFNEATGFYGVIGLAILAGLVLSYSPMDAMQALFWSAVINGVIAVPLMALIMLLAQNRGIMGGFTATKLQRVIGWAAVAIMAAAAAVMFAQF